jgi:biopolymer transport protein ExbB/TolQ
MNLIEMWGTMTWVAKGVAFILFFMSMWSFGVAIERIYTFTQARNQSKAYAPQVAKHLKDGRLKDAIALSGSKNFRYSHLAKVVLAGLQEYQFQQEAGGGLSREDLVDSVRRSIQRATALDAVSTSRRASTRSRQSARTARSSGGSARSSASSTRSTASRRTGIGRYRRRVRRVSLEALVETRARSWSWHIPAGLGYYNIPAVPAGLLHTVEIDHSLRSWWDYFIKKTGLRAAVCGGALSPARCLVEGDPRPWQ